MIIIISLFYLLLALLCFALLCFALLCVALRCIALRRHSLLQVMPETKFVETIAVPQSEFHHLSNFKVSSLSSTTLTHSFSLARSLTRALASFGAAAAC